MKPLKQILTDWIRVKRFNVFILFLLMALLISIVIKLSNKVTYTLRLELSPIHNNPREVLLQKTPQFIDVTFKSNGFDVLKYAFSNRAIQVDFRTLEKSSNAYFWKEQTQREDVLRFFDNKVDIVAVSPNVISFNFDEQSVKTLPVKIQSKMNFSPGYDMLYPLRCYPDSIDIVGPKTVLDSITEIWTVPITFDNLNSSIKQPIELEVPSPSEGLILTQSEVTLEGQVEKFTEGVVQVPVRLLNVPEDQLVSIFPKEVPVVFYTSLEVYNTITSKDFIVECDFNSLIDSKDLLSPKLIAYPSSVKRVSLQLNHIEYVIKPNND